jgi:signal transduction histidine kinase/CheY-like chemotaxis protein
VAQASAFTAAPVALLLVDPEGILLLAEGRAASRLLPLVGQAVFQLAARARFVPDEGASCSAETAIRRALVGEDLEGLAYVDGRMFEARMTRTGVGACVVALDVTRHQAMQTRAFHEERSSALASLAAGVATELSGPLTYTMINIEHVVRRLRSLSAAEDLSSYTRSFRELIDALAIATEGANRVRLIARDVLVFAQGADASHELVDVRAILESALQVASHELRHRARVVRELADVPPLHAGARQLAQLFFHLLINAAQAIPEGNAAHEEVRVITRCDASGDVVVEIRDTGTGIAPDALPHVFDPFFTGGIGRGVGLGLSVCHGIVKQLGGRIGVESEVGEGSVFRVVFPVDWPSTHGAKCRVLVVDADPLVGDAIARSLEEVAQLTVATDAREAQRILVNSQYDLVLCDVMLPETSGVDLYVELLRVAPHLVRRMVFMAGGASTARSRAFLSGTVNPCLGKPIDMGELRRLVGLRGPSI